MEHIHGRCPPGIWMSTERGSWKNGRITPASERAAIGDGNGTTVRSTIKAEWIEASIETRLSRDGAVFEDEGGALAVLFDGYLQDVRAPSVTGDTVRERPAETVAALYREKDIYSALLSLRGSFAGLIVDLRKDAAYVFVDRTGSRPLFYRNLPDGSCIAGPTVWSLARFGPGVENVDSTSVFGFLVCGSFFSDQTLFHEIRKVGYGQVLSVRPEGCEVSRYWRVGFYPRPSKETDLVDSCDALLKESVERCLGIGKRQALHLSGGVDSRVLSAYLRSSRGEEINAATYFESGTEGDDARVAEQIAKTLGFPCERISFSLSQWAEAAVDSVLRSDCRAEVIDAAPLGSALWDFSQRHDTIIIGDEAFGWHGSVTTPNEALTAVGWFRPKQVARLLDWLRVDMAPRLSEAVDAHLDDMITSADDLDSNATKDRLYYEQRLNNMLNAFGAVRLIDNEQLRPLVGEDILEFIATLPNEWRVDKRLLRRVLEVRFPKLAALPFARRDVLPGPTSFVRHLRSDPEIRALFYDNLDASLHSKLEAIFDKKRIIAVLDSFVAGASLPPMRGRWYERLPGMWRVGARPENRVHPLSLILRLIQINLYLKSLKI